MQALEPFVIRQTDATPVTPVTPGMDRRQLLDHPERWVGWVQTEARIAGGWHHHGERDSYVYVLSGSIAVEYGVDGSERLTARAGDLIFNPAHLVHREITEDEAAELLVIRLGPGPLTVNLD
jgi:mannose-6-phosphate isomerase-like protein (cupin superfamily)